MAKLVRLWHDRFRSRLTPGHEIIHAIAEIDPTQEEDTLSKFQKSKVWVNKHPTLILTAAFLIIGAGALWLIPSPKWNVPATQQASMANTGSTNASAKQGEAIKAGLSDSMVDQFAKVIKGQIDPLIARMTGAENRVGGVENRVTKMESEMKAIRVIVDDPTFSDRYNRRMKEMSPQSSVPANSGAKTSDMAPQVAAPSHKVAQRVDEEANMQQHAAYIAERCKDNPGVLKTPTSWPKFDAGEAAIVTWVDTNCPIQEGRIATASNGGAPQEEPVAQADGSEEIDPRAAGQYACVGPTCPQYRASAQSRGTYEEARKWLDNHKGPVWEPTAQPRKAYLNRRAPPNSVPCRPPGYTHTVLCHRRGS